MKYKSQFWSNPNASKFHEEFRELLATHPVLSKFTAYQEVNVQDLVPDYPYRNHHFDFYIKELDLVVELNGAQHYKVVNFNKKGMDDAVVDFRNIQYRDSLKQTAALKEGFKYIAIPYKHAGKITYELLMEYLETLSE